MRKNLHKVVFIFCFVLYFLPIPISVLASGNGFVASKNSDVFHIISCYHVNKIYDHNKIYFDTYQEAQNSGRRGCYSCNPSSWYDNSGASISSAKKDRSQYNAGYTAGLDAGYDEGYDYGYDRGYDVGYEQGKSDTLLNDINPQIRKTRRNTFWWTLALNYFFIHPIFSELVMEIEDRQKKKKSCAKVPNTDQNPKPVSFVSSKEIKFADYRDTVLIVIFENGKEFHHYDVPVTVYDNLMSASSKYDYYITHIQNKYPKY